MTTGATDRREARVLVTGASGFVGHALAAHLAARGRAVRAASRRPVAHTSPLVEAVQGGDIAPDADWRAHLAGIDAVVHCAARAHVLNDAVADPLVAFRLVNTAGTLALARQCIAAGVRRFVFISSIGVNGGETHGRPYTADDPPAPHSAYALSKLEAEEGLRALARESGMEVTIVRPPLVLGPGAPGNVERLLRALHSGTPLPFASVDNRRSLVSLPNLLDLIDHCIERPEAANRTFLVSDGQDISTRELVATLSRGLGRNPRLVPVPPRALRWIAEIAGKRDLAQSLLGSLQVDIAATRATLHWAPPIRLADTLAGTAEHYVARRRQASSRGMP